MIISLLIAVAFATSFWGLGDLVVHRLCTSRLAPPFTITTGIAVACVLLSFLLPFELPLARELITALVLVGLVRVAFRIRRFFCAHKTWLSISNTLHPNYKTAACVLSFFICALLRAQVVEINVDDDLTAYYPLAQRYLLHSNLTEPFSLRRLASWGGSSILQAMYLTIAPMVKLHELECVFWATLCFWMTFLSSRGAWRLFWALLFISDPYRTNFAISNGAIAFLLAAFLRGDNRSEPENRELPYVPIFNLAAFALVRAHHVLFLGAYVTLMLALCYRRNPASFRQVFFLSLGILLLDTPAALAMLKDSNTIFFPAFRGNAISEFKTFAPIAAPLSRIMETNNVCFWLFSLSLAIWTSLAKFKIPVTAAVWAFFAVQVAFTLFTDSIPCAELGRYIWPFHVCFIAAWLNSELWLSSTFRIDNPFHTIRFIYGPQRITYISRWGIKFAAFVYPFLVVVHVLVQSYYGLSRSIAIAVHGPDPYRNVEIINKFEHTASKLLAHIPQDSNILAAVEVPHYLYNIFHRVSLLDVPGNVWPNGSAPSFTSPQAVYCNLADIGYSHLIFTLPEQANIWSFYSARYWRSYGKVLEKTLPFLQYWRPRFEEYFDFLAYSTRLQSVDCDENVCVIAIGPACKNSD